MNADALRALAKRCRELYRIAVKPEIKAQLRQWSDDFDAEAKKSERRKERWRKRLVQPRLAPGNYRYGYDGEDRRRVGN